MKVSGCPEVPRLHVGTLSPTVSPKLSAWAGTWWGWGHLPAHIPPPLAPKQGSSRPGCDPSSFGLVTGAVFNAERFLINRILELIKTLSHLI